MKIQGLERDLKDFTKEIKELKSYIDGDFESQSISNLQAIYKQCESLISEYSFLEQTANEALQFIENIEE